MVLDPKEAALSCTAIMRSDRPVCLPACLPSACCLLPFLSLNCVSACLLCPQHQFVAVTEWSGGLYISPTVSGSRPGGLIAAAWASLVSMGESGLSSRHPCPACSALIELFVSPGFTEMARSLMQATQKIVQGWALSLHAAAVITACLRVDCVLSALSPLRSCTFWASQR